MEPIEVTKSHIVELASADDIVGFFAKLRYNTNARVKQTPSYLLNTSSEDVFRQINKVELIANQDDLLQVYLFELKTVTVAITQAIAKALRNVPSNILMVLTSSDYERVDFVLLEKLLPKEAKRGPGGKQIGVMPRVLSVKRRNPQEKELKILRRLAYTEEDGWAQYEKLVSAFSVINWTTDYYTNRALFSDYVLNNRLRGLADWQDNPTATFREMTKTCYNAGPYFSQKPDWLYYLDKYIAPILKHLGFEFKQKDTAPGSEEDWPDYYLYLPDNKENAVCGLCAFPWNRLLDATDTVRDPQRGHRIPGQYVVGLLEKHDLPWFMVTNGKIWRIYSKKTHSKATEFYEIDLEEILAMEDPNEAFRFFWLLFRAEAFKPKPYAVDGEEKNLCLLDRLFLESETYAKELGDKLKDKIFKEVFPKFAKGFIARMGGTGKYIAMDENEREAELDEVFRGTLTFLYRMLFLFYAESRDLLPVREVRGYWEVSLQKMKEEIKDKAGPIREEVETNLKKGYGASDTTLYDRLTELFTVIDKGARRLNVPTYNGGLFITDPDSEDESLEAANARFLKNNKILDRFLAEGIDLMSRELEDRTTSLEFIDYKSLGVRQLGSIYEGLLEFKVRVAPEDLAVVRGKKTEEYKTLAEAKKAKEVIKKGDVYLENDKHERKASGSYYTPDYIVKYIVENTVGPVLAEKMEKLKPKLRSHEADPGLKDELFEIRVLDPAMGSGHFLVETVDFVTDKMVDYLSRFPNNPVQIEINKMREEILREMGEKEISVDPARLNDLNLLRRLVLKRCIYGVDLNPMAVELAKVSLWLHCFTLGAPLSFLDHHLKCGNSLIGAKVDEVNSAIKGGRLFISSTDRFGGITKATDFMLKIGELSDVTPQQVKKSRESYTKALSELEPYKRMCDIYVSRWFGNEVIKTLRKKKVKRGTISTTLEIDPALEFLKSPEADALFNGPKGIKSLSNEFKTVVDVALKSAKNTNWRFFHWELEFPEVWYSMGNRKENPGFDAVVGNPPYLQKESFSEEEKPYIITMFPENVSNINLASVFISQSKRKTRENGCQAFIVPKSLLFTKAWENDRDLLMPGLISICDVSRAWDEVLLEQCIYIWSKRKIKPESIHLDRTNDGAIIEGPRINKDLCKRLSIIPVDYSISLDSITIKTLNVSINLSSNIDASCGLPYQNQLNDTGDLPAIGGDQIWRYETHSPKGYFSKNAITKDKDLEFIKKLKGDHIVLQRLVAHVVSPTEHIIIAGTINEMKQIPVNTLTCVFVKPTSIISPFFLNAWFNSSFYSWYAYNFVFSRAIRSMDLYEYYVVKVPMRKIFFTSKIERNNHLMDLKNLYTKEVLI